MRAPSALPEAVPEVRFDGGLVVDDPVDPIRAIVSVEHVDAPGREVYLRAGETETVRSGDGLTVQVTALAPRERT